MNSLKNIRVFGYPWHVGHQFELAKLFKKYDLLINPYRDWGTKSRPIPENSELVYKLDKDKYDLAILHVDQTTIDIGSGKNSLFLEMKELTEGMNRVVINHMVPIHDKYETQEEVIEKMKELVGDIPMVCNSFEAQKMWGWGHAINHGLDPEDWYYFYPKEPRIIIVLSPAGMDKAYKREFAHKTITLLAEKGINVYWVGKNMDVFPTFEEYKEYLGRSAIFFFPAKDSPFPRARTEAMLSGCCIVTTPYHDIDNYITHGENGYLVQNPWSAAVLLEKLVTTEYRKAIEIGEKGRQTAKEKLNIDRWADDWEKFLKGLGYV